MALTSTSTSVRAYVYIAWNQPSGSAGNGHVAGIVTNVDDAAISGYRTGNLGMRF